MKIMRCKTGEFIKAVAHRPQDIADIGEIVRFNKKLDVKHIKTVVREFANILEKPEIWNDISNIVENRILSS